MGGAPAAPPLRIAERSGAAPLAALPDAALAAPDELERIAAWNRAGRRPARNGFSRQLPAPRRVDLGPEVSRLALPSATGLPHAGGAVGRSTSGSLVWGGAVRVEGAYRLRLHLSEVELPRGARIWVYAGDEAAGPVGLEALGPEGLWTPSVRGPSIRLEVELPLGAAAGDWGFVLDRVLEIFRLDASGAPRTGVSPAPQDIGCLEDAQCVGSGTFDVIDLVQQAIARYQFVTGGQGAICTGGLLNDTASSGTPYFLTANHCFATQAEANTVDAFWDDYTPFCNGPPPDPGTLPRSFGGNLLATGASSDYTLLRLNSIPPNRAFLGWNANPDAAAPGTVVHRVSNPFAWWQQYSRSRVDDTLGTCNEAPRPSYFYLRTDLGGVFGGSSGAPAIRSGGQAVGQLFGSCGPDPEEGCDYSNAEVDGAFSESFSALAPFLTGQESPPCVESHTTLCLNDDRFQVEVDWRDFEDNRGPGRVVFDSPDSGLFWFFDPDNWEMLIKVLDGCPINDRFWVFFAATTNVEFTVTVTDTETSQTKEYFNPLFQPADAITDTDAFATCP